MMKVLSLGAGVQSTAMLLLALEGAFGEKPDHAVFADPGWETQATYEWLEQLKAHVAPFEIVTVSAGRSIRDARTRPDGERFAPMPFYLVAPNGDKGMGRRQCTDEYKLSPIRKHFRSLGATAKNPVECWIGISTDEAHRMKPSAVKYVENRYPLINAGMTREGCQLLVKHVMGSPAPKSSCVGCPYHGDDFWARLRADSPQEFEDACEFDEQIRQWPGMRGEQYLHPSCTPLRQISEFKHEKQLRMFIDAFDNECEGMCGV